MEAFTLGFWFIGIGVVIAAVAKLWLVDAEPKSGGHRPGPAI